MSDTPEPVPELDENSIPTDAEVKQATDEEWLTAMSSVPREPDNDYDRREPPDGPGGQDEDTVRLDELGQYLDEQDDESADRDIDDTDAELVDVDDGS